MAFVIGGLIGASMLTYFSFAQNYDELIGSNLVNSIFSFIMPKHDVYLYAVTEPNTYTIRFDVNGGYWAMDNLEMTYDKTWVYLPLNTLVKDWAVFNWWNTEPWWTWTGFADWAEVFNLTTEDWGEVRLYAQRAEEISYTIEYCLENIAWTWCDVVETWEGTAASGSVVIETWNEYTWFTLRTGNAVISGWIVQYYYTRNMYNLIVNDRGKIPVDTWVKYGDSLILPADPEWTWNTFLWWFDGDDEYTHASTMPAHNLEIISKWDYGEHSVTFDTDWWTEIPTFTGNYGEPVPYPEKPTKTWYEFVWWEPEPPETITWDDIVVKAIWKEVSGGGWWSGWWWRWWGGWGWWDSSDSTDSPDSPDEPSWEHGAAKDKTAETVDRNRNNMEVLIGYMWARSKWIIDTARKDSDPDGYIPRWDMAELVVRFTENVLGRKVPPIPSYCKWWDPERDWWKPNAKMYAEKSCALWVMWIRMQNFLPNKILDRAEFWTILSRLLWWDKYDVVDATATKLYYTRHLWALNREWIMTQIDNPEDRWELRKWAWLMLMRVKT